MTLHDGNMPDAARDRSDPKSEAARLTYVELNEALVQHSSELVSVLDAGGHMRYVSPSITRLLGYDQRELNGARPVDFAHPDDAQYLMETFRELQGTPGRTRAMCVRLRHKNGNWHWMEGVGENMLADPVMHGIVISAHDVTERVKLGEEIKARERYFRALLESSSDLVILLDAEARITYLSPSVRRILGFDSLPKSDRRVFRYLHPDDEKAARDAFHLSAGQPGEGVPASFRCRHRDGSWHSLSVILTNMLRHEDVRGVIVNARDTTTEEELTERLRERHKLEAIGRLAGGIAHDFNNILTVTSFYSDSILKALPPDAGLRLEVEEIKKASERATELTRQLLAFGRRQVMKPETIALAAIVRANLPLASKMLREDITVIEELSTETGEVEVDAKQFGEVVVSLIGNAAASTRAGGVITIATENREVSPSMAAKHHGLKTGSYVALEVTDSGGAIEPSSLARLFEPFYRAKNRDRGNGLALSAIYGAVKQSGGYIIVTSPRTGGATFTVLLPRRSSMQKEIGIAIDAGVAPAPTRRVLVAEDEDAVREVIRVILEREGHTAVLTSNGEEALAALLGDKGMFDVVVTDTIMPAMGGQTLVEHARKFRPDLPVVFISGYSDDAVASGGDLAERSEFVRKPFSPAELIQAIHSAIRKFSNNDATPVGSDISGDADDPASRQTLFAE
ncbi:MAG: PAS domain S-box protein [Gemmatimonadota bacterium]|nr:PAS domain S-box protein [Gemmatimonadota bacterium]